MLRSDSHFEVIKANTEAFTGEDEDEVKEDKMEDQMYDQEEEDQEEEENKDEEKLETKEQNSLVVICSQDKKSHLILLEKTKKEEKQLWV